VKCQSTSDRGLYLHGLGRLGVLSILLWFSILAVFPRATPSGSAHAHAATPRSECAGTKASATLPATGRLVLLVPTTQSGDASPQASTQLCEVMSSQGSRPLYLPLPSTDVDLSSDERFLAYSDWGGLVHLVDLRNEASRVLGRGVGPRFSPDGRSLAFVAAASAPLPGAAEWLEVYQTGPDRLTRIGPAVIPRIGVYDPSRLVAWSPRGDRIAWVRPNNKGTEFRVAVAALHASSVTVTTTPITGANGISWSATGDSILYWLFAYPTGKQSVAAGNVRVMGWRWPNGPESTVVPADATSWIEGAAPAPVPAPAGNMIASLLGSPHGGLHQIVLFIPGRSSRHIPLPGEPTAVHFAPGRALLVAIWTQLARNTPVSHAGLVDIVGKKVYDLGPAVAAFWLTPSVDPVL